MVDVLLGGVGAGCSKSMILISPPPNFSEKVKKIGFKLKTLVSVCVLLKKKNFFFEYLSNDIIR